jgi:membrane protein
MVIMLAIVAVLPPLLERLVGGGAIRWVIQIVGYILLFVIVTVALAILYRFAPDRDAPKMKWVSVGALIATLIWLLASIGFSIYTSTLGNYAKTYGAFAGIVIFLFWLWLTSYAILLGAEINAESEQQTVADTTKGPEEPLGERGAVKADSTPPDEPEKADAEKAGDKS